MFIKEEEKLDKLWDLLNIHSHEKVLVYVYRVNGKNSTVDLAKLANEKGFTATHFHGELEAKDKQKIIEQFKNDELNVVFATNAFGMGIDIPDIRVVIHFMIPESIAQYYQEVGRASRDQLASNAYLFYTNKNIEVKRSHFIDKSFPTEDELLEAFNKITSGKAGLKALPYYDDEQIQKCLQYFLDIGIMELKTKSIANLDIFKDVKNEILNQLIQSTRTKNIITTLKKNDLPIQEISDVIFGAIAKDEVKLAKTLGKCIIIDVHVDELTTQHLKSINNIIEQKRKYKHAHLDYLLYLLDNCENSRELHQEIGRHLGVSKFNLNKIYSTSKGDLVRSKSEVIIANLLYQNSISYEYEKDLTLGGIKVSPDFTITHEGQEYYWEHLGMIGVEDYDTAWLKKLNLYKSHAPNQLITTFENPSLSSTATSIINKNFSIQKQDA